MNKLDETLYINSLLELYGSLLTDNQKKIMDMYYEFNLSFGEIGDELSISRAAVNDAIRKSVQILNNYENKLNLLKKREKINNICEKISDRKDIVEQLKEVL